MLLILSSRCQKFIAFNLLCIFLLPGIASWANVQTNDSVYNHYDDASYHNADTQLSGTIGAEKNDYYDFYEDHPKEIINTSKEDDMVADNLTNEKEEDIGGPSQPEMSAFKPVGADNMVDLFTGDFSYNVPLLDVGGYPVNVFYNSGISMDQEASWVGLGWNINPGTIMRNMRGVPDDFDSSDIVTKTQFTRADQTWGVTVGGSLETYGFDALSVNADAGIFYNNQHGVGLSAGISPSIGIGSLAGDDKTAPLNFGWGLQANSQTGGSQTFSMSITGKEKNGLYGGSFSASLGYHSRMGLQSLHLDAETYKNNVSDKTSSAMRNLTSGLSHPTIGTSINFAYPAVTPGIRTRIKRSNWNLDLKTGLDFWGAFGNVKLGGYYSNAYIKKEDIITEQPAYGMLYLQHGKNNKNALLDFNRLNDGVYTPNAPTIGIPAYTYDVFSISGEGTGGSFRAYRGDLGYINDAYSEVQGEAGHLGIELGGGGYGKGGVNANLVLTPSSAGIWDKGNLARKTLDFKNSYADYQSVYFKNPGEKAIPDTVYQNAIGAEDLVRLKMINTGIGSPSLIPALVKYSDLRQRKANADLFINEANTAKKRDKRTQVISFLTAEEASRVGLDAKIPSVTAAKIYDTTKVVFGCNNASSTETDSIKRWEPASSRGTYRRSHHISEIDVLGQDGRKYVYGIPVYNTKQVDITFNKTGNAATQISQYLPGTDNAAGNNQNGKDYYVEKEELPPFTHAYLLSALLSPNYVDVKGDGITEDDMGDAIKFNYGKMDALIKWRTPAGKAGNGQPLATFSEGLKTDANDDKSHYIYGERESWYLYSVESKNMVARFYVSNERYDAKSVLDEEGGIDEHWGAQRLTKIALFSKADLLENGDRARPVKTVHFQYDYSLCPGTPNSIVNLKNPNKGKLTLRSIYFTYNGNEKVKKNYYHFNYPADKNYGYDFTASDRWGNYKPATANPGGLQNPDYSYTSQDKTATDRYNAAWTLNQVVLPSGGAINITYEADDYAYVQDRRAANMCRIMGFGDNPAPDAAMLENRKLYRDKNTDYDFIYIKVDRDVSADAAVAKRQIADWYLANLSKSKQLFMKLAVTIKSNPGSGYELIPIYADIDTDAGSNSYGVVPGHPDIIYIKIKKLESGYTPMVQNSLQFMKNFLPTAAYPGYDVSENGGIKQVIKALGGLYHSFKESFRNGMMLFKSEGKCKWVETDKSFVRLTNPYQKKLGGGLRVKKIVIDDNWDKMTNRNPASPDGMPNATYGQEYFYTKTALVNGVTETISSGVASWEPSIGGEENPHREIMSYFNKNKMGPYDYSSVELPLAEMFFPSPSVGYSRVEVRSIHRDTVKNAAGIQVSEFYTSREFPTKTNYTPLEEYDAKDRYDPSPLLSILKIDIRKAVALSQGFKVDLNDMNGKMKKQATYSPINGNDPISYSENFYNIVKSGDNTYQFNHYFPVIAQPDGKVKNAVIGREIELMTDFRQHQLETVTTNLNFNLDVINGFLIPIPIPTWFSPVMKESDTYRSAAVLKVVNHYAVLDSVVAVDKGSMVSTKNLVYDAETGDALLTRTNNEFNRPLYNFSYPAHWGYSGMGPAYKNIDVIYSGLTFKWGKLETAGVNMNLFESGDEIYVYAPNTTGPMGTAPCDPMTGLFQAGIFTIPYYSYLQKNPAKKIWAVNTAKAGSLTPQFVFMDAYGSPYMAKDVTIKIIRSGKRNMLGAGLGNITSLSDPFNTTTGRLDFSNAEVINTAAATYKDHWRVDDRLIRKDTIVKTIHTINPSYTTIYPVASMSVERHKLNNRGQISTFFLPLQNNYRLLNNSRYEPLLNSGTSQKDTRTWLQFDLQTLTPTNIYPLEAFLDLPYHARWPAGTPRLDGYHLDNRPYTSLYNTGLPYAQIDMLVTRMQSPWYSQNSVNNWTNIFDQVSPEAAITATPLQNSAAGPSQFSTGANVTSIFNKMLANKRAGSAIATAFKIQMINNANAAYPDLYQCLNGINSIDKPSLRVSYFDCDGTIEKINKFPIKGGFTYTADCSTNQLTSYCVSKFAYSKTINPYVEGIWGNWRVDTTYTYYGKRKEQDPAADVDIRTAGTIANFKAFWQFPSTGLLRRNPAASDVWVWNSTITQYNRKGYDIENKDPLGRYNAGLYGYNQQLPVAVVTNSRYRESMFDGFEDYDYTSNSCTETCKPRRHASFGMITPDATEKHSGRHSVRVTGADPLILNAPVVSNTTDENKYELRVKVDSTTFNDTIIHSIGNGLTGYYYNHQTNVYKDKKVLCPGTGNGGSLAYTTTGGQYPFIAGNLQFATSPAPNVQKEYYSVRWKGKLVPRTTGTYIFKATHENGFRIKLGAAGYITNNLYSFGGNCGDYMEVTSRTSTTYNLHLTKGEIYDIEIDFYNQWGPAYLKDFNWIVNGIETPVDQSCLYADNYGPINVEHRLIWCTKSDSVYVKGNALTDTFSLIPGKKMLLSAWVKEGGNDCKCVSYANNSINISYTGSTHTELFVPKGSIIEGWQRFESEFTIPDGATAIRVTFNAQNAATAYFDDVRIHPFNANMKSFVYHPQNLRLMAELDENNYASFYEYDDDGTLTRLKKETERGIKTIQETRSALQKAVE